MFDSYVNTKYSIYTIQYKYKWYNAINVVMLLVHYLILPEVQMYDDMVLCI